MPNKDKTGPEGKGKLTGRGLGPCLSKAQEKILGLLGLGGRRHRRLRDGGGEGKGTGLRRGLGRKHRGGE